MQLRTWAIAFLFRDKQQQLLGSSPGWLDSRTQSELAQHEADMLGFLALLKSRDVAQRLARGAA